MTICGDKVTMATLVAIVLLLLGNHVRAQCVSTSLVNVSFVEETVYLFEGREANVTITIDGILSSGMITFRSTSEAHFVLNDENVDIGLILGDDFPTNVTVAIQGKSISLKKLEILFTPDGSRQAQVVASQNIGVKRVPRLIQTLYIYIILVWILVSYLSMGGSIEVSDIWEKLRRPWGILIGLVSQFIVMPALAYVVALLLARDDATTAVGIVLVGTCPGGWLSNIFSVLLDVDFVLSITMTFISTFVALGMMPLNLYIYATPFTEENSRLRTPFKDLAQQLAILFVPCIIGLALSYKFPRFKKFCKRVVKPVAVLLILLGVALGVPSDLYAFTGSPLNNWIASILIPGFGAFFGLSLARIFARDLRTSITIALETGVQNALLGRTIVALFYPQPEADLISRVVLTVVLVTLIEGSVAAFVYSVFRYVLCRARCDQSLTVDEGEITGIFAKSEAVDESDVEASKADQTPSKNGSQNPGFEMSESEMRQS